MSEMSNANTFTNHLQKLEASINNSFVDLPGWDTVFCYNSWVREIVSGIITSEVDYGMEDQEIIVYGTTWCPDCLRAKRVLDQVGRAYTYVNIEADAHAATYVMQLNRGCQSVPTIVFPDGSILVEPSSAELKAKLIS
jgi:mycoredoxin